MADAPAEDREKGHGFCGPLGEEPSPAAPFPPLRGALLKLLSAPLPALHPSCDRGGLCSQQPPGLPADVRADGLQRGLHLSAALVSRAQKASAP